MLKIISQVSILAPRVPSGGRNHPVPEIRRTHSRLPPYLTLQDFRALRLRGFKTWKLRDDRLRARLRPPPRWNLCRASQRLCCARSNRRRVRGALSLFSVRSRGPHRLFSKESRESLLRI